MKGFTLIEMLVALFIFGLLMAAGVAVMRVTIDNQAIVRDRTDRLAEFQRLRAILKADLSQAAERRIRGVDGRAVREALYGGEQARGAPFLRLARRGWDNPDAQPRPSVQYVEYWLDGSKLLRAHRSALDGGKPRSPQVLIEDVSAADIEFLKGGQWIRALPGGPTNPLPQAVRINLTIAGIGQITQLFLVTGETR